MSKRRFNVFCLLIAAVCLISMAGSTATPTPIPPVLSLHLFPANPNPFSAGGTYFPFWISTDSTVAVRIFTVTGEVVRDLAATFKLAGNQELHWDGNNDAGREVATGVYIYRVQATNAK